MLTIYTIGHGRKGAWEIGRMLDGVGVTRLVDVRTYPSSKHNPQSNRSAFEQALGDRYHWLGWALGGYKTESVRANWSRGMEILIEMAERESVAIMCSEGLPDNCHRQSEIVPELYRRLRPAGVRVVHIMPDGALRVDRSWQGQVQQESLFE
jgi:uncharacterized protein (DUF488 family)